MGQLSPQNISYNIRKFQKICPFLRAPGLCGCCKRTFTDIPVLCFTKGTQSHSNTCSNVSAFFLQKGQFKSNPYLILKLFFILHSLQTNLAGEGGMMSSTLIANIFQTEISDFLTLALQEPKCIIPQSVFDSMFLSFTPVFSTYQSSVFNPYLMRRPITSFAQIFLL